MAEERFGNLFFIRKKFSRLPRVFSRFRLLLEKGEKRSDNTRKSSTGISRNEAYFEKFSERTGFRGSQKSSMRAWQISSLPALFFPQSK